MKKADAEFVPGKGVEIRGVPDLTFFLEELDGWDFSQCEMAVLITLDKDGTLKSLKEGGSALAAIGALETVKAGMVDGFNYGGDTEEDEEDDDGDN